MVRRAIDKRNQDSGWAEAQAVLARPGKGQAVKRDFDEYREKGRVMVSVPSDYLDDILSDGLKNQFDSGDSGGVLDNDIRAVDEAAHQGIRPDAPGSERPVYGYIGMPGNEHPMSVHNYGDVTLVLKDSVRGRTTVTLGDSLNTNATPVPLEGQITPRQVSDASARNIFQDDFIQFAKNGSRGMDAGLTYMEAQIKGGVRREHISMIVFGANADMLDDDSGVEALREEMRPYGIEVKVRDYNS